MSSAPTPPADDFPAGQTGDMRDVLLSPPTGAKPPTSPAGRWEPPTAEELQKLLPQYEITALLGRGGMGAVYKGTQKALDRPVAIKILSTTLDESDQGFAERFKNEARAMAKLKHPGIVDVYDSGETADGLLYIVMEFIEGTDVAKMIAKQKRLHTEHAIAITAHVCDALAYAHERGIIHRDIKPANIMVGYDGVVKVADFGLAKMTHSNASGLTQSGMAMGTLHYMAPEALMLGSAVDHRADIYAVGVMLYQMLTGKVPHGMFELPSIQVKGLDPRYDGIIARAMREDREVRYQSVMELRHDLDAILTQPVVKVEPSAEKAPAALETQARPQRPGGQPYRQPQPQREHLPPPKKSSGAGWAVAAALGVVAWLGWKWMAPVPMTPVTESPSAVSVEATSPSPPPSALSNATTSNPAEATKDRPFVNSLGMKFVPVPGTKVLMCIHETRRIDYATFAAEVPKLNEAWKSQSYNGIPCGDKDDHPVVGVSWEDASKFCEWLSKKDVMIYRLSTDEEWSIAVGLGEKENRLEGATPEMLSSKESSVFPWEGDYPPLSQDRAGNYGDAAWIEKFPNEPGLKEYTDGFPTTAPVMNFKPNKLGLYDMGGNVWEWVEDWWNSDKTQRVARGTAFDRVQSPNNLLASRRVHHAPGERLNRYGFRVVIEAPDASTVSPGARPQSAATPKTDAKDEWISLDDGKTLTGWEAIEEGSWQVVDGAITCTNGSKAVLYRVLHSPWFELTGEIMSTSEGNGGVIFHSTGLSKLATGMEVQIAGSMAKGDSTRTGGLFSALYKSNITAKQGLLPDNTFGQLRLVVQPGLVRVWINGTLSAEYTGEITPPTLPLLVLTGWAGRGSVAYRNLRIRSIDSPAKTSPSSSLLVQPLNILPAGPTTWTDTKGRSITATFKAIASGNVLLDIAGKVTPVPLNTLSAESQKLARAYHDQSNPATTNDPAQATKDRPFVNSLGMKFVPVPGTKVLFCIHETRRVDFAAFAKTNPSVGGNWDAPVLDDKPLVGEPFDQHPVAMVSREDAETFCKWLTIQSPQRYRLPTDAEWSLAADFDEQKSASDTPDDLHNKAVSGSAARIYPWGTEWPPPARAGNYSGAFTPSADTFPTTAPVMAFLPNKLGLYDIGGNLWEWVSDQYWNKDPISGTLRGSGWSTDREVIMRCGGRFGERKSKGAKAFGFRVVLELPTTSSASSVPTPTPAKQASAPGSPTLASSLASATKDRPFVNTLGMKFVPVPGTKVLFCIHETRRGDYKAFFTSGYDASARYKIDGGWKAAKINGMPMPDGDDYPVAPVHSVDAQRFCNWLGELEGVHYRLPTDHEWSLSVGLMEDVGINDSPATLGQKNSGIFPWGQQWPPPPSTANLADTKTGATFPGKAFITSYTDQHHSSAPVMSYKPNSLGIYDLAGNVWEWCGDIYDSTTKHRVLRGGAWDTSEQQMLFSSYRDHARDNDHAWKARGFRVVIELSPP